MEQIIAIDFFDPMVVSFIIDLVLATVLGAVIGAERELRGKDAGMSTHIL